MSISQANRFLSIETPAGTDVLLINRFSGTEAMSDSFRFEVELLAENDKASGVDPTALMGKGCTISLALNDDFASAPVRHLHGIVHRFYQGSSDERFTRFRATLVPWTYLLARTSDCRIFQDKSALEVVTLLLDELKGDFSDQVNYRDDTSKSYTKIDYQVQYNETDYDFISRLLEKEGIYYYFEHEDGKHTLVLGDDSTGVPTLPNQSTIKFDPEVGFGEGEWEGVAQSWEQVTEMRSGKYTQRDYNFQMPSKTLETSSTTAEELGGNSKLELFQFPGEYGARFNKPEERMGDVEPEGRTLTQVHIDQEDTAIHSAQGSANVRDLASGHAFTLDGHPTAAGDYVLTSVHHAATQSPHYVSERTETTPYANSFTCQPKDLKFFPRRVTPKPNTPGVLRGLVVGPDGEEIKTDKFGRIKVKFPWDRLGEDNDSCSCWLRVSQVWAGQQWGAHFWPRIGHEVLVDFLNGDINHPIVVGCLYNAENMPPYDMPDNQTRSGIKTRSTPDGDAECFNELRFEDKKDEEEIYFHAERDFNRVVENNDTLKVGFDKAEDGDQTIEIHNNQALTVGNSNAADGSQTIEIYKDRNKTIKTGDENISIEQGDQTVDIAMGNQTITLGQGNREVTISMGNDDLKISMGNQTTKLDLGKSETEAMQSIELKVGSSSVKVDQMGVTIKGMMVKIEGTTMTEVKGMMTQVKGDAMLKMQGGLTMIN